ncbi:uncharacterized protein TRUGW13939_11653 [Talaromyces rugulosus]|uniref:Major facilitator superfamily (MFS) profile domain-containing protein n=1 Tax=Talaromyces rugulosus TaxID=121627 RepID=A0A7H8RDD4_TALRU|nr:uncharacterized protein TRUGW13939_11653 [Talaromyces rugulosus]QKX64479.1 hypothetical protein TRUGW13939_11653 [Talaromyces rugulosus]
MDQAAEYLSQVGEYPPMSPTQEKRLLRKMDWILVPMLLTTATLGAVDKVAISTAAIYGLRDDLHLSGSQYSWAGSILYFGCIVGMWPSSYVLQRVPSAKYLACCSIGWSILSLLIPACRQFSDLMVLRFLMGCLEGIIVPSISLVIAGFYKKSEQPPRNAIAFAAVSSVINGFLSWAVGQIPSSTSLSKWQYLFLITGSISLAWSLVAVVYLPDTPMNAWFLSEQEKFYAISRQAENKTGIVNKTWKRQQAIEAVADPKTWIIFLFNIAINVPNGGLITFSGIIINNLGFSAVTTSLLNMPTGIMSTLSAFLFSWVAAKWTNRRCFVTIIAACIPAVGISLGQANTAGHTKKNVQYSIMYIGYAVGNLIGPQTFRANQAPEYTTGFAAMLVCYCLCIGLMVLYWALAAVLNTRRETLSTTTTAAANYYSSDGDSLAESPFADMTDYEQREFKYTT